MNIIGSPNGFYQIYLLQIAELLCYDTIYANEVNRFISFYPSCLSLVPFLLSF